ncbi:magnesium transporter [Endozoicomonas lisbonensis]|uniref:Mg/Co/Ni transporter MgtE n=1 Tax=Endozoicomonas lisbonensis TaxID=3120522 RepID=A0ABV2SKM9_9GAMM
MFNAQARTAAIGNVFNTRAENTNSDYLNQSVMDHFQARIGWMVMLALFGFISGYIITSFEDTLSSLLILAVYIPMIADSGGNSGSQAASVIIQALAKNDLHTGLYLRVLWKELRIAIMTAGVISIIAFCKVALLSGDAALPMDTSLFEVAFVISFALAVQIVVSTLIGATIPLGATRAGINPAVMTSPMLTSIVDIFGMLIYFGLATSMLNI